MNRRDFLKMSSAISAFGLIAAGPLDKVFNVESEAIAFGKIYRAVSKGRIMVSADKGKSWQVHTNFGSENAIADIFVATDRRLYVKLNHQNHKFYLVLGPNKQSWQVEKFAATPRPKV
jgi:hypothetical protein